MTTEFTIDEAKAREHLSALEDDAPYISIEGPAASIDTIVYEAIHVGLWASGPDDVDLLLYPLRYESDPDGLLIAVSGRIPTGHGSSPTPFSVTSHSMDWDDVVDIDTGDRASYDRDLTPDETIGIVREVFRYANELLPVLHQAIATTLAKEGAVS